MSRYHFDIADGSPVIPCDGVELNSLAEARAQAIRYAGQKLYNQPPSFWEKDAWVMTISDADHLSLFSITISTSDAPAIRRMPT